MVLKDVLSTPSLASEINTLNLVILTISIFSARGAGWIILSFLVGVFSVIVWAFLTQSVVQIFRDVQT